MLRKFIPKKFLNIIFWIFSLVLLLSITSVNIYGETVDSYDVLQSQEVYIVAYSDDYSPFSYVNSEGDPAGIAVDVMNYVAETAGIYIEYISIDDAKNSDTPVDINLSILSQDQLDTNTIDSTPYYTLPITSVTLSDDFDYEGATVGHLDYVTIDDNNIEETLGCQIITYSNYDNLADDLANGTLDYIFTTSLVAKETDLFANYYHINTASTGFQLNFLLSFSNDMDEAKIEAFNTIIENSNSSYIYNMILNSVIIASENEMTSLEFFKQHVFEILAIFLSVAFITIICIFKYYYNKKSILLESLRYDSLTGLYTSNMFIEESRNILKAETTPFVIISFDIDNENISDREITILRSIITMAKSMNIQTVSEGVECENHVKQLKELSCDIAQGYFYSKPLPEKQFLKFVKDYQV